MKQKMFETKLLCKNKDEIITLASNFKIKKIFSFNMVL